MKDGKQVTEILEAFDLTRSFRSAGELAGCSPNTVAAWVDKRDRGDLGDLAGPVRRERMLDPFMAKIEEWVDRSNGKSARSGGRSRRRKRRGVLVGGGCIGPGSPSRACGRSGTGARARPSTGGW